VSNLRNFAAVWRFYSFPLDLYGGVGSGSHNRPDEAVGSSAA